jgi:hypothetical protein
MGKILKAIFICLLVAAGAYLIYRFVVVRTVYYEIAGIKIPSRYNMLTGTVKPIKDYSGKAGLKTVEARKMTKVGLSEEQTILAKLRWSIFEEWANAYPAYKGWRDNPEIFKKANEDFKKQIRNLR